MEQDGTIRIRKNGQVLAQAFLDISAIVRSPVDFGNNEEGLLGLAFHPDYATNGWFFVYYTNTSSNNEVARYTVSSDPDVADAGSRQQVILFNHPSQGNHNGGMIAFGTNDGHLYIGTGDGGGGCDLSENSQNGGSRLGKMHRIDVDSLPYTIPSDNPFVSNASFLDEIWAYGLRNPWRWSFDRANGDLYIGDVGQGQWEEVDWRPGTSAGGENYGWDNDEGNVCPNPSCGNEGSCTLPSYVGPVVVYANAGSPACPVTGGYVYRDCRMPDREHRGNLICSIRLDEHDNEAFNRELIEKYRRIEEREPLADLFETEACDVLLAACTPPARMAKGAVRDLREAGVRAGLFRPLTLWPFPVAALERAVAGASRLVVVEASDGQLEDEVRLAASHAGLELPPILGVRRYGGVLPSVGEIVEKVLE